MPTVVPSEPVPSGTSAVAVKIPDTEEYPRTTHAFEDSLLVTAVAGVVPGSIGLQNLGAKNAAWISAPDELPNGDYRIIFPDDAPSVNQVLRAASITDRDAILEWSTADPNIGKSLSATQTSNTGTIGSSAYIGVPWDTVDREDDIYSLTPGASVVTINDTGVFLIQVDISISQLVTPAVSSYSARIAEGIVGAKGTVYSLLAGTDRGIQAFAALSASAVYSVTITRIIEVETSGFTFKVQAKRVLGSTDAQFWGGGCSLSIVKIE